jgi:hypothetical protein
MAPGLPGKVRIFMAHSTFIKLSYLFFSSSAGLLDEISDKIYEALAYHVTQANMNGRIRHVGLWSLQMTAQAVLNALRSAVEPTRGLMMNIYELGSPFEMS